MRLLLFRNFVRKGDGFFEIFQAMIERGGSQVTYLPSGGGGLHYPPPFPKVTDETASPSVLIM